MLKDFQSELKSLISNFEKEQENEEAKILEKLTDFHERFPELYNEFKVNLIIAKLIISNSIRKNLSSSKSGSWDVLKNGLLMFEEFYAVRIILTIGKKSASNNQNDYAYKYDHGFLQDLEVNSSNKKGNSDYDNADVMYWLFENFWLHPMRTFISSRWDVKSESKDFAQILT